MPAEEKLQDQVLRFLQGQSEPQTQSMICRALRVHAFELSGLLWQMYAGGEIDRVKGFGPRGGNGYIVRDH